jgi:hypothetical protein
MRSLVLLTLLLSGCASQASFDALLKEVPKNCHTTIDAMIQAGVLGGINGSGHFQQECWPEGLVPQTAAAPSQ